MLNRVVEISANKNILFPDHVVEIQSACAHQELIFKQDQDQDKIKVWSQIKTKQRSKSDPKIMKKILLLFTKASLCCAPWDFLRDFWTPIVEKNILDLDWKQEDMLKKQEPTNEV